VKSARACLKMNTSMAVEAARGLLVL